MKSLKRSGINRAFNVVKSNTRLVPTLSLLAILTACENNSNKPPEPDPVVSVNSDDTAMNNAISRARAKFAMFKSTLASDTIASVFSVKVKYPTTRSEEHIWVTDVTVDNFGMKGVIDNDPANIPSIKLGDTVKISEDDISDWMYIKNDSIYGGYTIRVLRIYMTESEKAAFDSSMRHPFAQLP
jgi:uncharacterized protein YegJ (DUF2314 family)